MAADSSPLPIRRSIGALTKTPSLARESWPVDEADDDLTGDTIPCSPSALLRGGDREGQITQPTQILSRPSLGLANERSSSPASVIEVPASSPFQNREQPKLASRLAPAGTFFRPPARPPPTTSAPKRPAFEEPISLISDDEDDEDYLTPPRGDIRPTTFKAQIAAFAYNPAAEERETKVKLRQIYDVFGDKYPSERVREALKICKNDLDDAIIWLETQPPPTKDMQIPTQSNSSKTNGRRLISKGSLQARNGMLPPPNRTSSPSITPSPPKPPKRRLVQGLKRRDDSSPQKPISLPPSSSQEPSVIDLVDNDEDAYEAEPSPGPSGEEDDRVLTCLNTSTLKELAAMTGMKEALLEPLVDKRPFDDLSQARRVSSVKKPGARKAPRVSIGESAVDAIEVFLNAVAAIDEVVAKCEIKGQAVKTVMDSWDMDMFGYDKNKKSSRGTPDQDLLLTPTSLNSKYVRPLLPAQPHLMDGHCTMKPFQLFGLNWMTLLYNYGIGCILADEMGLGKTCQVISFMCQLVEEHERQPKETRPWPNLVVVPPSTYNNWLYEFERFAPGLSVVGYRGSQSERAEIAYLVENEPEAYHVVLATYSQINSEADIDAMKSFDLNAAVFDEGHKMKNPETKIYRDLRRIPSAWKMLLTGTPVQNNLLEMTSLLSFINPAMFDGYMDDIKYIFSQKVTIRDVSNGAFLYAERVRRARTILEPFILQRRKDQVLSDMPQKICTVVHCDMSESQKEVYRNYEEIFKTEPSQRATNKAKGRQNDQNNVWMQLRKAALHPLLFRRHFTDEKVEEMGKILMDRLDQADLHQPDLKHLIQELKNSSDFELHLWCRDYPRLLKQFDISAEAELDSGKVKKLLELLDQYRANGDRVLVFSKFSRLIELLQEVLANQGVDHRVLMGNTSVAERQGLIDEFNDDPTIPAFLLTTGAGGTGINLTAANKVIIFDQSDNPQDDIQAENRAHRLGQKKDVEVVRLIASKTIEELIYKACQKKIELANKVTGALEEGEDAEQNMEQEVRKMMMEDKMTPP